jgi:hypothetical protein
MKIIKIPLTERTAGLFSSGKSVVRHVNTLNRIQRSGTIIRPEDLKSRFFLCGASTGKNVLTVFQPEDHR